MLGFQHPVFGRVEASGRWFEQGWLWLHYFCPPVWNGFLFISACVFSLLGIDTHKMKCSDMGSVRRMLLSRRHGLLTQTLLITTETGKGGHPQGDEAVGLHSPKSAGVFELPKPEGSWGSPGGFGVEGRVGSSGMLGLEGSSTPAALGESDGSTGSVRVQMLHSAPRALWWSLCSLPAPSSFMALLLPLPQGINPQSSSKASFFLLLLLLPVLGWS